MSYMVVVTLLPQLFETRGQAGAKEFYPLKNGIVRRFLPASESAMPNKLPYAAKLLAMLAIFG